MTAVFSSMSAADIFRAKSAEGDVVNVHVVKYVADPEPNFDAMQRLIAGVTKDAPNEVTPNRAPEREVSTK